MPDPEQIIPDPGKSSGSGFKALFSGTFGHAPLLFLQCQLSVLLERQGLLLGALTAAQRSRDLLSADPAAPTDQLDRVHVNLGRLLAKLGRYEESIAAYRSVASTSFHSQVGLALSYFYAGQFRWGMKFWFDFWILTFLNQPEKNWKRRYRYLLLLKNLLENGDVKE